MLFVKPALPLHIACQVVVVGKVEAFSEVFGDLFDENFYFCDVYIWMMILPTFFTFFFD